MISYEPGATKDSDYYVYTASPPAEKTFPYPMCVGHFFYDATYSLKRSSYDSFLIIYMKKGQYIVTTNNQTYTAGENQIVLLDCYRPHGCYTNTGWESEWIHFDGIAARAYFQMITEASGPIVTLRDSYRFEKYLHKIYQLFRENASIKEALVSQYITDILTELLVSRDNPSGHSEPSDIIEETTAYMNEHLTEPLILDGSAARASLSPYYFTRLFKKETGFTPHEYLIAMRISSIKSLLRTTSASIKEICFLTGFANESSFCTIFKKWVNTTPGSYREYSSTEGTV